jgi:hypothetical protein
VSCILSSPREVAAAEAGFGLGSNIASTVAISASASVSGDALESVDSLLTTWECEVVTLQPEAAISAEESNFRSLFLAQSDACTTDAEMASTIIQAREGLELVDLLLF